MCNSFLYTNNIQKYYSVSRCVISIIIVIAPSEYIDKINGIVKKKIWNILIYLISYKHIWFWLDWVKWLYLNMFKFQILN